MTEAAHDTDDLTQRYRDYIDAAIAFAGLMKDAACENRSHPAYNGINTFCQGASVLQDQLRQRKPHQTSAPRTVSMNAELVDEHLTAFYLRHMPAIRATARLTQGFNALSVEYSLLAEAAGHSTPLMHHSREAEMDALFLKLGKAAPRG